MNLFAPIFRTIQASDEAKTLLGDPVRVYDFGQASEVESLAKPYVVWQNVGGGPENYLADRPEVDNHSIQVDVYADTASDARRAAAVVIQAIESSAYVTRFNGEDRDPHTRDFRFSFDVDWIVHR